MTSFWEGTIGPTVPRPARRRCLPLSSGPRSRVRADSGVKGTLLTQSEHRYYPPKRRNDSRENAQRSRRSFHQSLPEQGEEGVSPLVPFIPSKIGGHEEGG